MVIAVVVVVAPWEDLAADSKRGITSSGTTAAVYFINTIRESVELVSLHLRFLGGAPKAPIWPFPIVLSQKC